MADVYKLVFTFDTDTDSSFVFGVSNAKATPVTSDIGIVAQSLIDGNVVIPKKGNVTKLKKVEQVATTTTEII